MGMTGLPVYLKPQPYLYTTPDTNHSPSCPYLVPTCSMYSRSTITPRIRCPAHAVYITHSRSLVSANTTTPRYFFDDGDDSDNLLNVHGNPQVELALLSGLSSHSASLKSARAIQRQSSGRSPGLNEAPLLRTCTRSAMGPSTLGFQNEEPTVQSLHLWPNLLTRLVHRMAHCDTTLSALSPYCLPVCLHSSLRSSRYSY